MVCIGGFVAKKGPGGEGAGAMWFSSGGHSCGLQRKTAKSGSEGRGGLAHEGHKWG